MYPSREEWIMSARLRGWARVEVVVEVLDRVAGVKGDSDSIDCWPYLYCEECGSPMINRVFRQVIDCGVESFEEQEGVCQECVQEKRARAGRN